MRRKNLLLGSSHRDWHWVTRPLTAACVAFHLSACSDDSVSDPARSLTNAALGMPAASPSLTGVVLAVESTGQLRLEYRPLRTACQSQALATPDAAIRVVRRDGTAASRANLTAGTRLSAWFGPTVLESCPAQVTAVAVVIEP